MPYLRPDGKTQVTVVYEDDQPVGVDTVVVSSQHAEDISIEQLLTPDVEELVVQPELEALGLPTTGHRLLVNPTGKFVIGGPDGIIDVECSAGKVVRYSAGSGRVWHTNHPLANDDLPGLRVARA